MFEKKSVMECVLDPWFPLCSLGAELLACLLGIIYSLPYSIRYLLEATIRNCDGFQVNKEDVEKILVTKLVVFEFSHKICC